jgi:hypothetical protein
MSIVTSCALLTSTTWVICDDEPTCTTNVTGIGVSGKYLKCTMTEEHVASTPVTMCADAGSAMIPPTTTQAATATASTLKRRLMDLRIFSLRENRAPRQCRSRVLVRLFPAQREITR